MKESQRSGICVLVGIAFVLWATLMTYSCDAQASSSRDLEQAVGIYVYHDDHVDLIAAEFCDQAPTVGNMTWSCSTLSTFEFRGEVLENFQDTGARIDEIAIFTSTIYDVWKDCAVLVPTPEFKLDLPEHVQLYHFHCEWREPVKMEKVGPSTGVEDRAVLL